MSQGHKRGHHSDPVETIAQLALLRPTGAGVIVQTASSGLVAGPVALNNATFTTIATATAVTILPGQKAILSAKAIYDVASGGTVQQDVSIQLVDEAGNIYDASEQSIQGAVGAQVSATVPCLTQGAPHALYPGHVSNSFTFSLQAKLSSGAVVTSARFGCINVAVSA